VIQSIVAEHNKVLVIGYENSDDFFHHSWKYVCWSEESVGFMNYENRSLIHIQGDSIIQSKTNIDQVYNWNCLSSEYNETWSIKLWESNCLSFIYVKTLKILNYVST